jgi:hypothetical protein
VPEVGQFVKVISAGSVFFLRVGRVVALSDDRVRVLVNFGVAHDKVNLPHDILAVTEAIVLPAPLSQSSGWKPRALKDGLQDFFANFVTVLPRAALASERGIGVLVAKRPRTAEEVLAVEADVHPACAADVAQFIAAHELSRTAKKSKGAGKTKAGKAHEPGEGEANVGENAPSPQSAAAPHQSSRGRTIRPKKMN